MSSRFMILIVILALFWLRVDFLQIELLYKNQITKNKKQSQAKTIIEQTLPKRFLQTISLNTEDKTMINQEVLVRLNSLRSKNGKSQLKLNKQFQQIIERWSSIFKSKYPLDGYLSRLGRFSGSLIFEFRKFESNEKLLKTIQQKISELIGYERLTQIGIFTEKVQQKFNVLILIINFNVWGQIKLVSFQDDQKGQGNLSLTSINSQINSQVVSQSSNLLVNAASQVQESTETTQTKNLSISLPSSQFSSKAIQNIRISNTIFRGIVLYHQFPQIFSNTEKFLVRGRLLTPPQTNDGISVMIFFRSVDSSKITRFMKWIPKGESEVGILLDLNKLSQGKYQVSANVGELFTQQNIYTVGSVSNQLLQETSAPLSPQNLSLSFEENKLYVSWKEDNKTALRKVLLQQGSLKREYILSNFQSKFEVPFKDFYDFNTDEVTISISSAHSSSLSQIGRISQYSIPTTLKFNPISHHFSETIDKQIQLDQQIVQRIKIGESITISGKASSQLSNKIVIEEPSKTIAEYYFNEQNKSQVILEGQKIFKKLTFTQPGVYILQINNVAGSAVINKPIYVGDKYPLLPDFVDLRGEMIELGEIAKTQPTSIIEQRRILLKLINQKRAQFEVKPVISDPQLDRLAQYHTDDMISRDFFGHVNPQHQGPQDRATKLGITQGVAENLAMNINLTDAHYRLCRSPAHLVNIVNKYWETVGLGISRNSEQYFYIAQEFQGRDYIKNPLTEAEINIYKAQIISYIKELYPSVKFQNINLSSGLSEWQNLTPLAQNSQSIMSFLRSKGPKNFSIGNIRLYFRENFIDNLKTSGYLETDKPNPTEVGLGIKMDKEWLEIFIGYI